MLERICSPLDQSLGSLRFAPFAKVGNADARRRRRSRQSSGSNPSASITVTRCPARTASMALTMPTAPNPMTVACWRASFS